MNKTKLFLENFIVFGLGGAMAKLVPILMVPIVTRLMPDSFYFGLSDLASTLISFGAAFAVFGMYDAMYRLFFEKDELPYKKEVCSTAMAFTLLMSVVVCAVLLAGRRMFAIRVFHDARYTNLVVLCALSVLVSGTNTIVAAPTRMQNRRKLYLLANILAPTVSYAVSIPLIIKGYYVVALPLAALVSALCIESFFWVLNREWFSLRLFRPDTLKELLKLGAPLVPNFLIYWVFGSCDRLMIADILGTAYTGIYAIGAKLGACSQFIYVAFAGGWQYFAFATMKEKDQVRSNSLIFEYLGVISFAATVFVMALAHPIYGLIFTGDYVGGYVASGYLFMAPLLQMLFQVIANQFLVVKKTWPSALILSFGAVVNVVLNLWLIPVLSIEGAAIATLCGYLATNIVCCAVLLQMKLMVLPVRFIWASLLTFGVIALQRLFLFEAWVWSTLAATLLTAALCLLYRTELAFIWTSLKNRKNGGTTQ